MRTTPIPVAIPVVGEADHAGCSSGESFALMVLGESMRPEFDPGDIVVIEPDGRIGEGSFVIACCDGEWMLRRLASRDGRWTLEVLNPAAGEGPPVIALADLTAVRGVVIQKSRPGRRRALKRYVE